jgi:hypothetical protein
MPWPVYSRRFDARTITTHDVWVDAYTVPSDTTALLRFVTVINTGAATSLLILGYGSGHQVIRWAALAPGDVVFTPVWIVWDAGDVMQWQCHDSSFQVSLHGQLLSAV